MATHERNQPAILFDPPGHATRLRHWKVHLANLIEAPVQDKATKRAIARARWEIAARERAQPEMPGTLHLICGPGPFHPLQMWEEHLRSLRRIKDKDAIVFRAIRDARRYIRWLQRYDIGGSRERIDQNVTSSGPLP